MEINQVCFKWCNDKRGGDWPKRAEIVIDGKDLAWYLEEKKLLPSAKALWQSVFESGDMLIKCSEKTAYKGKTYTILECACGDPDCDSILADIHCDGEYLVFRDFYTLRDIGLPQAQRRYDMTMLEPLIFEVKQWQDAIEKL
ncbi:hypothetical protein [Vibrio sp. HN007]|uniref:hypothetical protein n=1 Tax=Vibrio iocasae TaxID=3098914 RepID=UPI0035D48788